MWRKFLFVSLIGLISGLFGRPGLAIPSAAAASPSKPTILAADTTGLWLSWELPDYQTTTVLVDGQPYSQLELPGLATAGSQGGPDLPYFSGLVGLPPSGEVGIEILAAQTETLTLPYQPLPAPSPWIDEGAAGEAMVAKPMVGGQTRRLPDDSLYGQNRLYPARIAELLPAEQIRTTRVSRLRINPIRVNPVSREAVVLRSLRLAVHFAEPATVDSGRRSRLDQPLAAALLNPGAVHWATRAQEVGAVDPARSGVAELPSLKVVVTETGLHVITYDDLAAAGWPVDSLDPRTFSLYYGPAQRQVALVAPGEADGTFDPGDRILFFAAPTFSRFTNEDVYILSYDGEPGLRMDSVSGDPSGLSSGTAWATAEAEVDQLYRQGFPGRHGDHWFWENLSIQGTTIVTPAMTISSPQTGGPAAGLTIWLQGYTSMVANPDHRVSVAVNGTSIGQVDWNGPALISTTMAVPAAKLQAGQNAVTVSMPGLAGVTVEGAWLDALALTYPIARGQASQLLFEGDTARRAYTLSGWDRADLAVFDITDPFRPRRVTGLLIEPDGGAYRLTIGDAAAATTRYLVVPGETAYAPQRLVERQLVKAPAGGTDYIIISHPAFIDALTPLVEHRRGQGLRVTVVDAAAIYDTYSGGRYDAEGIRTFLAAAYQTWNRPDPEPPQYVLLVGDGHYDFKNQLGWGTPQFIPPYLADVDPWLNPFAGQFGETAADNRYAMVSGDGEFPDLMVGRLPVNTVAELETVIDKIIHYETDPYPGNWNSRQLFVADNPDSAGNFHQAADLAYNTLTGTSFVGQRFYLGNGTSTQNYIYADAEQLRTDFLNRFDFGAGIVVYHGHSSIHQWAVEQLLRWNRDSALNDIEHMVNGARLPIMLQMTCFTGSFHEPEFPTMDESLLRQPGGGAVAIWGSSGLGVESGHTDLQAGFYTALTHNQNLTLGQAILAGQLRLYGTSFNTDLLDTFHLFGDPAMQINLQTAGFPYDLMMPLVGR